MGSLHDDEHDLGLRPLRRHLEVAGRPAAHPDRGRLDGRQPAAQRRAHGRRSVPATGGGATRGTRILARAQRGQRPRRAARAGPLAVPRPVHPADDTGRRDPPVSAPRVAPVRTRRRARAAGRAHLGGLPASTANGRWPSAFIRVSRTSTPAPRIRKANCTSPSSRPISTTCAPWSVSISPALRGFASGRSQT